MITIDATVWLALLGLAFLGLAGAVIRLEIKVWKLEHLGAGGVVPKNQGRRDIAKFPPSLGVPGGSPDDAAELRAFGQGFPPPRQGYQPDGDGVPEDPPRPPRGGSGARPPLREGSKKGGMSPRNPADPVPRRPVAPPPGVFTAEYDPESEGNQDRASDHTGGGRR